MREFGILLLVPFLGWTTADASQLYRCEIRDAVSLGADGRLERNQLVEKLANIESPIIVDTSTGAIRVGQFGSVQKWDVVQAANSANDFVAVQSSIFREGRAAAATDFIRIRAWEGMNGKILFIKYSLSIIFTGTCDFIQ